MEKQYLITQNTYKKDIPRDVFFWRLQFFLLMKKTLQIVLFFSIDGEKMKCYTKKRRDR